MKWRHLGTVDVSSPNRDSGRTFAVRNAAGAGAKDTLKMKTVIGEPTKIFPRDAD